jgi:isovaleryl-CoA dehydrogenase
MTEEPRSVRALGKPVRDHLAGSTVREGFDYRGWELLSDDGLWRIPVPERYGGAGGDWSALGGAFYELGRCSGRIGFCISLISQAGLVRLLLRFGTEDQRERLVPLLIGGSVVGSTAVTEPGGGSDVGALTTTALPAAGAYRLSGAKAHVTNAPIADVLMVVARIAGENDPRHVGLFLMDRPKHGATFEAPEDLIGHRDSPTGGFVLADVAVPADRLIGERSQPLDALYATLSLDRALFAMAAAGVMDGIAACAIAYARERHAFGQPIIRNQYVQRHLTDVVIGRDTTLALARDALAKVDADDPRLVQACSTAKLIASESLVVASQANMLVHGHTGYLTGAVSTQALDALGTRIAGGTSDIQRVNILRQELSRC